MAQIHPARLLRSVAGELFGSGQGLLAYLAWNLRGVRVTRDCRIHPNATLAASSSFFRGAMVHERACIGAFTYGTGCVIDNAVVGKFCSIAPGAMIGLNDHPIDRVSTHPLTYDAKAYNAKIGPSRIGNDVWIGANVVILAGVVVPDGCVVAAGAVVTKDVEPFTVVGGVPARPLAQRDVDRTFADAVARTDDLVILRNLAASARTRSTDQPTQQPDCSARTDRPDHRACGGKGR